MLLSPLPEQGGHSGSLAWSGPLAAVIKKGDDEVTYDLERPQRTVSEYADAIIEQLGA